MDFKRTRTIYDQIADHICENILQKRWAAGDRIPSVRDMAVQTEVNPNTVLRSYTTLQDLAVIVNQRGKGYFVADDAHERVMRMKKEEFINEGLPALVRTMDLLSITAEQLKRMIESLVETRKGEQR
jgi:GntR family transcriptional regulator